MKKIFTYLLQILILIVIILGVSLWQGRNMLEENTNAPDFTHPTLSGNEITLGDSKGKKVVLYFFAPWCTVCRFSSHNIVSIRNALDSEKVSIYAVALSYRDIAEIKKFKEEHSLNVPVILGTKEMQERYRIGAFPSIYLLDKNGKIRSRLIGYSTEAGIRLRLFMI